MPWVASRRCYRGVRIEMAEGTNEVLIMIMKNTPFCPIDTTVCAKPKSFPGPKSVSYGLYAEYGELHFDADAGCTRGKAGRDLLKYKIQAALDVRCAMCVKVKIKGHGWRNGPRRYCVLPVPQQYTKSPKRARIASSRLRAGVGVTRCASVVNNDCTRTRCLPRTPSRGLPRERRRAIDVGLPVRKQLLAGRPSNKSNNQIKEPWNRGYSPPAGATDRECAVAAQHRRRSTRRTPLASIDQVLTRPETILRRPCSGRLWVAGESCFDDD